VESIEGVSGKSSLTEAQLESLIIYRRVASGELTLKEAASLREKGPVTLGSFYRVVGQARNNVRESIATVVVSMILGYVKVQDLRRLLELVSQGTSTLGEESLDRVAPLIMALIEKIVM
jgi:hypothetical protein